MQFRAVLSPVSHIHAEWRGAGRPVATLGGVVFHWRNHSYVSDVLEAPAVAELMNHPYVTMELVGKAPAYLMDAIQPPLTIDGHAERIEPAPPRTERQRLEAQITEEITQPVKRGRKPRPPDPLRVHRA